MHQPINPTGLCQCGCGRPTPVSPATYKKRGIKKGDHFPFCRGHRKAMVDTPDAFWSRVNIKGDDECWEWTAYINGAGYGITRAKGNRCFRAHRIAYELTFGEIPDGLFACHKCDNPKCCNPKHLFAGTPADNVHDMLEKGRESRAHGLKGEKNHGAKLTQEDVSEIRRRYSAGNVLQRELADEFNVSHKAIWRILNGVSWAG